MTAGDPGKARRGLPAKAGSTLPPRPSSSVTATEILDCGCEITKGWRCPVHNQP